MSLNILEINSPNETYFNGPEFAERLKSEGITRVEVWYDNASIRDKEIRCWVGVDEVDAPMWMDGAIHWLIASRHLGWAYGARGDGSLTITSDGVHCEVSSWTHNKPRFFRGENQEFLTRQFA